MTDPIVDRTFAEKFLTSVDRPFDYGVYFLFHDWWAEAPQDAIDAYERTLHELPGSEAFLAERFLSEPISLDDLADRAPGTLGHGYRSFIVDSGLEANLGRNYRAFNDELRAAGTLDRLPDDLGYTIVRGFQIHDFLHVLAGFNSTPSGELAQAGFHYAQMRFPYHAMRMAVTTAHLAFVAPQHTASAMDAISEGWLLGRSADNLHFHRWEDELDTPIAELRARFGLDGVGDGASHHLAPTAAAT